MAGFQAPPSGWVWAPPDTHYELLVYGGGGGTFNVTVQLYTGCPGEGGTPIAGTQHTFNNNPDGVAVELMADFDPPVFIPQNV